MAAPPYICIPIPPSLYHDPRRHVRLSFLMVSFFGRRGLNPLFLFVRGAGAQVLAGMASGRASFSWRAVLPLTIGLMQHQPVRTR